MNRRDFLKLFAITTAGIYVPTKSYFFMPQRKIHTVLRPLVLNPQMAIWVGEDKYMIEPNSVLYSQTITKQKLLRQLAPILDETDG